MIVMGYLVILQPAGIVYVQDGRDHSLCEYVAREVLPRFSVCGEWYTNSLD